MIVDITNGNHRMFKRMNNALIDRYKRKGIIPSTGQHRDTFEQTYDVKVVVKNSRWSGIEFPSEQAYTAAAIKWS